MIGLVDLERVLVLGDDAAESERLAAVLRDAGVEAHAAPLAQGPAAVVLVHGAGVPVLCRAVRDAAALADARLVALVPPGAEVDLDVDEVIAAPASDLVVAVRIAALVRAQAHVAERAQCQRERDVLAEIGLTITSGLDVTEVLQDVVTRTVEMFGADRGSLLLFGGDPDIVYAVAASDDPTVTKLPLMLERYPEVRAARDSRDVCVVEDAPNSSLLGVWAQKVAARGIGALVCLPLCSERAAQGVILLRFTATRLPADAPYDSGRIAAQMIALGLRGTSILERVREQTRRLSLARYETERRLRALEKYRDFIESTSDAMFVTDGEGVTIYVNRAAEQLTGYSREVLCGRPLSEVVGEPQRATVAEAVRQVAAGTNLQNFDLDLLTTSGDRLIVSCATSSVLADQGAAILSFRDVTEARALQEQLTNTKEFLERLIDSTVDAIVAADIAGTVILFNKGAERITGYRAEEVVGKLDARRLYPGHGGHQVMRELRSPQHGGVGRLELCRKEILAREGEVIPVNMTASIIYEEGREVATVGIFSDLRERLRIEERLLRAQEQLVISEKQALIAELAGTTAHELNQPLTSVIGCAELLNKRMGADNPYRHTIDTILKEAERMAEIVRKIGKITRYETKAYVGKTQILDLDKSTE